MDGWTAAMPDEMIMEWIISSSTYQHHLNTPIHPLPTSREKAREIDDDDDETGFARQPASRH